MRGWALGAAMHFLAKVYVTLKPTVNDPQGLAVLGALHTLGYREASSVRMGKYLELRLEAPDKEQAEQRVEALCRQLLANPLIELYRFEVEALAEVGRA